jgi:hypothetical protein
MSRINEHKRYCYRITHIQNLRHILDKGIVAKNHPAASTDYLQIGNPEIIDVRSVMPVKLEGYGNIGDYVAFYFTPKSMMLYNIITGFRAPLVPKRNREEILVIRCIIERLATGSSWFFTDGQGNDAVTNHFNDLKDLDKLDWLAIQQGNFSKGDGDYDRARRYQAEFLVYGDVPVTSIESLNVYSQTSANYVNGLLTAKNITNIAVNVQPHYFF